MIAAGARKSQQQRKGREQQQNRGKAAQAKGLTDGSRPQSFATRQEVAVMVNAALNTVK